MRLTFPMAARLLMHGPTPVSAGRVITTVAPRAMRMVRTRFATFQVNACSAYPLFVAVPTVLQGL